MKTFKDVVKISVYIEEATPFSEYPYFACTCNMVPDKEPLVASIYWDPFRRIASAVLGDDRIVRIKVPENALSGTTLEQLAVVRRFK